MSDKKIIKILEAGVYDDTKTISLMDRFEGIGKDTSYQQLVLRNIACLNLNGQYEYISLVVERSHDHRYIGDITFTELKQGQTSNLYSYLRSQISGEAALAYKDKNEEIRFDTPYLFRAQNSLNRSGYGWGYGGTQYGETTAYVFVGAYIGYKKYGFAEEINKSLEEADLSEFTIKNRAVNPSTVIIDHESNPIVMQGDDEEEEVVLLLEDDDELIVDESNEVENIEEDDEIEERIVEKRNTPDEEMKPEWFHAGFSPETNLFILALEQNLYLPPIIDDCELQMASDEILQDDLDYTLSDMEKSFMFFEMISNRIGYSGISALALDIVHKRKIIDKILKNNMESVVIGEYGENTISFHLVAEFLENQPELCYRGYIELILTKYYNSDDKLVYDIYGGFRDFGDNKISSSDRHYWAGKSRFLLDEASNGSYLQGYFEMIMERLGEEN